MSKYLLYVSNYKRTVRAVKQYTDIHTSHIKTKVVC